MFSNRRALSSYYRRTVTHSYSTLEISRAAHEEITTRLKEAGVENDYIQDDKIIFGAVALVQEPLSSLWARENIEILNNKE